MNIKKILSFNWLKTKLLLVIRDEETLEEKRNIRYTPAKIVVFSFLIFVLIFSLAFFVSLQFSSNPQQENTSNNTKKILELYKEVDSLSYLLEANNKFNANLKELLGGNMSYMKNRREEENKANKEGKKPIRSKSDSVDIDFLESVDLKIRQEFEGKNSGLNINFANGNATREQSLKDIYLFSPLNGIVSEQYNTGKEHYGVDVVAKKDAEIKSVTEGTVIFSSWTDDTGYVIGIQHKSNLVSVYKHCSVLLKKVGNFVRAGEIIAIIGNSGKFTSGPHLHFELWYKGNPVNPEGFVAF